MSVTSDKLNVVHVIVLIAFVAAYHVDAKISCTTSSNEPGFCVPREECTFISTWPNLPQADIQNYLELSLCGSDNNYVCCAEDDLTPEGLFTPPFGDIIQRTTNTTRAPRIRRNVLKSEAEIATGMDILRSIRCGNANADRVANGEDAGLGEFPWMVLLVYDDGVHTTLDCGGSLITDQYVLTAAHCIRNSRATLVRVRLGEYDTKKDPDCVGRRRRKCAPPIEEIDVEEAIHHQNYNRARFSNDIGLIRMARKAAISYYVSPICLPITHASQNAVVPNMQIAGWGRIETGLIASILQKARVVVRPNSYCNSIHKLITLSNAQLCAGGDANVATCVGDSGGPLFFSVRYNRGARSVQYGVVGAGSTACGTPYPDVFASTLAHLDWIAGNIRH